MGGVIAYLLPAMAQTRVLTAVDPATGARITRRTARTYVAVVVIGDPAQGEAHPATWCGRPDLAEKALRKFSRPDARLAPVVEDPWAEAEAAPAPAQAEPAPVVAEPEAVDRLGFATFNPETESISEALAAQAEPAPVVAEPEAERPGPVLPGEPLAQVEIDQHKRGQWQRSGIGPDPLAVAERRAARWAERNPQHAYRVVAVVQGEPEPVAARVAEPAPVTLPGEGREAVAALRADAAAGRRVSLASLARALSDAPELPELPTRFSGGGFAGRQPWDPGTPDARARVALQGERVATLWPIAQAVRGAGFDLPPVWWPDGPVMAGERTYGEALAALPLGAIAAAAAALAALPPVTAAQDRALRLCRGEAVGV